MRRLRLVPLLLLAGLSACASSHRHAHGDPNLGPTSMIYSPNGEPLNGGRLGRPTCLQAMSTWFARVDTDHVGRLSHAEFMADATAQFARMDIDHNGYLLPEELERYRLPYRQDASPSNSGPYQTAESDNSGGHRHGRHGSGSGNNSQSNGSSGSSVELDPVMSADVHNTFRVTPEDFLAQAERNFVELDINHDGSISLDELQKTCEQKKE
jgi:hypothetical protein